MHIFYYGQPEETVCVLGLGYIGLPTSSLLATKGFQLQGVDTNLEVVEALPRGRTHIYEPDLDVLVKSAVNSGNLVAALEPAFSFDFPLLTPDHGEPGPRPGPAPGPFGPDLHRAEPQRGGLERCDGGRPPSSPLSPGAAYPGSGERDKNA